jgi:hypothetical protein
MPVLKQLAMGVAIIASLAGVLVIMGAGFGTFWGIVTAYPLVGVPWAILTLIGLIVLIGFGFISLGLG